MLDNSSSKILIPLFAEKILELKGKLTAFVDDLKYFCTRKTLQKSLAAIQRYSLLKQMNMFLKPSQNVSKTHAKELNF